MQVMLEFHEKNKLINTRDLIMNTEQITALLNAKTILWPMEEKKGNSFGEIYESNYNPIDDFLLVRINEIHNAEEKNYSF